jgi:hypothetical protein
MLRYVVVPANSVDPSSVPVGGRYYRKSVAFGFNLYDNLDKLRLKATYSTRLEADRECEKLNWVTSPFRTSCT